jgi:hypothetical protein
MEVDVCCSPVISLPDSRHTGTGSERRGIESMGADEGFKISPALVSGAGASHGMIPGSLGGLQEARLPNALVLTPIFNRKTSSRPPSLPPFVMRLPHPSSLVSYPHFPSTD